MSDYPDGGRRRSTKPEDEATEISYDSKPPKQDDLSSKMNLTRVRYAKRSHPQPPAAAAPIDRPREESPVPKYEPLSMFAEPIKQAERSAICLVCGFPIMIRRVSSLTAVNSAIGFEIQLDPVPAGPTGEYVVLDDERCRLKTMHDDRDTGTFYMPHLRGCRRPQGER